MKPGRITVLILSALLFTFTLNAGHVDEAMAKKAALNHYRHYAPASKQQASITKVKEYKWGDRTSFYICSFDKGGFVLVSANDAVTPVLGYGFEHAVPEEITNEALKGWFDGYARQIDTTFVLNLKSDEATAKWDKILNNRFSKTQSSFVEPLLTTTWNQGWPYNAMCPEDPNDPGGHVWAGCVATAMSQILKYHNSPSQGLGSYGYQWGSYPYSGADFGNTTFNWANMPNSISTVNIDIATIIYQTAVSCYSMWGPGSTGVWFTNTNDPMSFAFINFFRMAFSSIKFVERQDYSYSGWDSILQIELLSNRPIYYRGDGIGSHAFVCDGLDNSNLYHFNWGWGGSFNGYFLLTNLTPGGYDFSYNHMAIIGIKPNDGSTLVSDTTWSGDIVLDTSVAVPVSVKVTVDPGTTIKFGENCKLQVYGKLTSIGTENSYIKYTAIDTTSGWLGIKFDNNYFAARVKTDSNDITKFIYSQIEYSTCHGIDSRWGELSIDNCKINNNQANGPWSNARVRLDFLGGGFNIMGYPIKISNSDIYNNQAEIGGGIFLFQIDSLGSANHPNEISYNNIFNNYASDFGGGLGFLLANNVIVKENEIHHNYAMNGAGLSTDLSSIKIISNKFCNNAANGWVGGALALYYESTNLVVNNLFSNNSSSGISCFRSSSFILNNTIVNNSGAGLWFWHNENNNENIKNCIIYGNDAAQINLETDITDPLFDHCDIQAGIAGFTGAGAGTSYNVANYTNNLDVNPSFINPSAGAGNGFNGLTANWSLLSNSPCIDAGDSTSNTSNFDADGNPRILLNTIDIGAFEYGNYWTGSDNASWSNPLNWKETLVPDSTSVITIPPSRYYLNWPVIQSNQKASKIFLKEGAVLEINNGGMLEVEN